MLIAHDSTSLIDGEYMTGFEAMALAAIDDDDLVLADELHAVDDGDDSPFHVAVRRARHEVQGNFGIAGEQLVAFEGFALRVGEQSLRGVAGFGDGGSSGIDAFVTDDIAIVRISQRRSNVYDVI